MIFQKVTSLNTIADKNYFKEKIDIYIKIVTAISEKNGLRFDDVDENSLVMKLIEMGVIDNESDLMCLKNTLGKEQFYKLKKAISIEILNEKTLLPFLINLNNTRRKELQLLEEKRKAITLVDFFCGAGGLSLGFKQTGYKTIFANDYEQLCIETYKYNHPEIPDERVVCGDIREISKRMDEYVTEDVDIVIGGPPCQGFSSANKHHRVIDDPRNELYKYYLKCVAQLVPKIVIMENVKGMLKVADQVIEDYESIEVEKNGKKFTYRVAYQLLMSSDFSVAQNRERLIYIALRNDICDAFNIVPMDIFSEIQKANAKKTKYNLSDALEGLKTLVAPHTMGVGEVDTDQHGRKIDINQFNGLENDYLKLINNNRKMPLVFNHKARYCSDLNQEIYKRMRPGDDATCPQIADIMPYTHRNDKFKDKYYRLQGDRPCRTITAHLRADCHSHIHPYEDRAITPREAARIQSFPDDYLFMGPYLKTYTQIGNAVPVVMARGIASVLKKYLGGDNHENI